MGLFTPDRVQVFMPGGHLGPGLQGPHVRWRKAQFRRSPKAQGPIGGLTARHGMQMECDRPKHRLLGIPALRDRRRHPRIYYPMPLTVRVGDSEFETVVRDLSAGGLCARLPVQVSVGQTLEFALEFSRAGSKPDMAPRVSARGVATRARELGHGEFEFAARFTSYRFVQRGRSARRFR